MGVAGFLIFESHPPNFEKLCNFLKDVQMMSISVAVLVLPIAAALVLRVLWYIIVWMSDDKRV